jgi:capsular polysaccharide biosynthesis protein
MRQKLLLILGVALVVLGGLLPISVTLIVFILPETFASTARIVPAVTEPAALAIEMEKLQSRPVLYEVIANLNLTRSWAEKMKVDSLTTDLAFRLLNGLVTVRQARNTHIFEVMVLSEDKKEAATIANEIVEVYRRLSPVRDDGTVGIQILEPAMPGARPTRPNKPLGILSGLAAGVVVTVVGVVFIICATRGSGSKGEQQANL